MKFLEMVEDLQKEEKNQNNIGKMWSILCSNWKRRNTTTRNTRIKCNMYKTENM